MEHKAAHHAIAKLIRVLRRHVNGDSTLSQVLLGALCDIPGSASQVTSGNGSALVISPIRYRYIFRATRFTGPYAGEHWCSGYPILAHRLQHIFPHWPHFDSSLRSSGDQASLSPHDSGLSWLGNAGFVEVVVNWRSYSGDICYDATQWTDRIIAQSVAAAMKSVNACHTLPKDIRELFDELLDHRWREFELTTDSGHEVDFVSSSISPLHANMKLSRDLDRDTDYPLTGYFHSLKQYRTHPVDASLLQDLERSIMQLDGHSTIEMTRSNVADQDHAGIQLPMLQTPLVQSPATYCEVKTSQTKDVESQAITGAEETSTSDKVACPKWDPNQRKLFFGQEEVKHYNRHPALIQIAILEAFEKRDWPLGEAVIVPGIEGQQLKDAIANLNKSIGGMDSPIRFHGAGEGKCVMWLPNDQSDIN